MDLTTFLAMFEDDFKISNQSLAINWTEEQVEIYLICLTNNLNENLCVCVCVREKINL